MSCVPAVSKIEPTDTERADLPQLAMTEPAPPDAEVVAQGSASGAGTRWIAYAAPGARNPGHQPMVVFFHGYDAKARPRAARHFARWYTAAGFTVLWLELCDPDRFACAPFANDYAGNAAAAYAVAWRQLRGGQSTGGAPVVFAGFSIGTHAAALLASRLGRSAERSGRPGPPAPEALIFLDPAGYPFAKDDSGLGLTHVALAGIAEDTPVLILRAQASARMGDEDTWGTGARLYHRISVRDRHKAAFVIPHACVTRGARGVRYECPERLENCRRNYRCYLSEHLSFTGGPDYEVDPHPVDLEFVLRSRRFARCVVDGGSADCLAGVPRGAFARWGPGAAETTPALVHYAPPTP